MIGQNINIGTKKLKVLVSPLDWGLGHATRIITIVKILQNHDVQVLIAAETAVATLLKAEFPGIAILPLKGYRVQYSRNKKNFSFKLLQQIPGIISTIRAEKRWLKKAIQEHNIDAVISDNRFGFYHGSIPSVYITHQLFIETGKSWMNVIAQKIHYRYINKFTECWVPDFEEEGISLAGNLSHPKKLPAVPVKYLGPLSRLNNKEEATIASDLLIILSGPEPQRTIWEEDLLKQIEPLNEHIILVRGKPGNNETIFPQKNLKIYNHLPAAELSKLINGSSLVLSRCGYSTVMDLVAMNKKAILLPTPGQAEQEYLATYLKEKNLFYTITQQGFQLKSAIKT
ncbi:MAG: glycosyl transferase family 28, partial [Sphingobacteriales bacterium]